MSHEVQTFLSELSSAGASTGGGASFTLRSDKAKEKLKKFALAHPENYFLLIIAAIYLLGARHCRLKVDADDLELRGDCRIERAELEKLWAQVAGSDKSKNGAALRLIGLAILTSVRFDRVYWRIFSHAEGGSFCFEQDVVKGELSESFVGESKLERDETVVAVKRKNLRQVASRFFRQMASRLTGQIYEEQSLVQQRVFLGVFETFELNQKKLDCSLLDKLALAVHRVGNPPHFLSAKYCFSEAGELPCVAVLVPESKEAADFPGEGKKITWLWHGLTMGESDLGLAYRFTRVFVIADGLATDLSFTTVADTWQRQAAERSAREAVRKLLENLVEQFSAQQKDCAGSVDPELEKCILEVARERIDVRRNRHRLAKFNRALVACPLFWGSAPDGTLHRYSLLELWERMEQGLPLAFFKDAEHEFVPAWPDRPVVVYGTADHISTLQKIFGSSSLLDAAPLARRLNRLVNLEKPITSHPKNYRPPIDTPDYWEGAVSWNGLELKWLLGFPQSADNKSPGSVQVGRGNELYFADQSIRELPDNFVFYGELPWEPDYRGLLKDDSLRASLSRLALKALAEKLDSVATEPMRREFEVASLIWLGLGGQVDSWAGEASFYGTRWIVVKNSEGNLAWMSPKEYFAHCKKHRIPHYFTSFEQALEPGNALLPYCLVLSESVAAKLAAEFPTGLYDLRGVELLWARPPFEFSSNEFVVVEPGLQGISNFDSRIRRVRVGFPKHEVKKSGSGQITLQTNLQNSAMQTRRLSSFVSPATICVDWEEGWPDSRGCHFVDQTQREFPGSALPILLSRAAGKLISENSIGTLASLCSETLTSAWLEVWTEASERPEKIFPLANGSRMAVFELRSRSSLSYFTDPALANLGESDALWIPEGLSDSLSLLDENVEWLKLAKEMEVEVEVEVEVEQVSPPDPPLRSKSPKGAPPKEALPLQSQAQTKVRPSRPSVDRHPVKPPIPIQGRQTEVPLRASVEEPIPSFPSQDLSLEQEILLQELDSIEKMGPIPHLALFKSFIGQLEVRSDQNSILSQEDGRAVLRFPQLKTEGVPYKSLFILSALYSLFNRREPEVTDRDERSFHLALLKYASSIGNLAR